MCTGYGPVCGGQDVSGRLRGKPSRQGLRRASSVNTLPSHASPKGVVSWRAPNDAVLTEGKRVLIYSPGSGGGEEFIWGG